MIFTIPRASFPIDGWLGHLLIHMQLETQLWRYWLVHIVVPSIELQTPSASWVLSLSPSLWDLCSIQKWLWVSNSVFASHWHSLRKQSTHGRSYREQFWSWDRRKDHPDTAHPGIDPINKYQTHSLLHMSARFCWQDPNIAISCEAMPVPGKYRSGCPQSSIGWIIGPLMKELEKAPKELKGSATL
jgi:hypothetical protein